MSAHRARATGLLVATLAAAGCSAPDSSVRELPPSADSAARPSGIVPGTTVFSDSVPVASLRPILPDACVRGDPAMGERWVVERTGADLQPLDAEPVAALVPRDSARLVARIARVVDALPNDTTTADLRGLPVVVREGRRIVPRAGDTVIVAFVARRLPIESSPLEEEFAIVAVPGTRQGVRDPLIEQWYVRQVGREESLEPREFVLALRRPDEGLSLLFVHEGAESLVLELVTRTAGVWQLEWRGPIARCG